MSEFKLRQKSPYRAQLIFVGLILIIGFSRHLPLSHPEWLNFSPVLSLFLLSGAMLRGAGSWITPICAVFVTDLLLNPSYGAALLEPFMLATGFSYLLVFLLGKTLVKTKSLGLLVGGGIAGALVFHFVTCSFAWWSNPAYAKTFNGLIQANTVGQPGFPPAYLFLKNTVASSILFTSIIGWVALRMQEPDQSTASEARTAGAN
ncbi:MAG: DUF6580 family putative transport protein [Opitutae bacterium]